MKWLMQFLAVENLVPRHHHGEVLPSTAAVYGRTLKMAWPSALEAILISLIGAVSMIMVGTVGTDAIAAVGITNQPKFLVMSFVLALNVGTTVIVSRRRGANDYEGANRTLRNALAISFMLSLFFTVLGAVFAKELLIFAGAEAHYLNQSIQFFRLIMVGTFFYLMGLTITAAQRGIGNTRVSLATNVTANVVNIIFSYLLINGILFFPKLGIIGAGIATALGNIASFILALKSVCTPDSYLYISLKQNWSFEKEGLSALMKVTSAALAEQLFVRFGFIMYAKAVAGLGTLQFATHLIAMNVMNITFSVGEGLSIATSSLVGQSLGAKRKDLAYVYGKASQRLGLCSSAILFVVISLNRHGIMNLFTDDVEIIRLGADIMIILCLCILFQIAQVITLGSLRGAGDSRFVALISVISVSTVRPALTYLMAYTFGWGLYGAWFSVLADQMIRYLASLFRFNQGKWVEIEL